MTLSAVVLFYLSISLFYVDGIKIIFLSFLLELDLNPVRLGTRSLHSHGFFALD